MRKSPDGWPGQRRSPSSLAPHSTRAQSSDVLIFAAASLKNVIDDLAAPCKQATGVGYKASYAASSTLAKQLAEGAPAEIFISADLEWMDDVARRNLIENASRVNLLGNDLVLVAPKASTRRAHDRAEFRTGGRARHRAAGGGRSGGRAGRDLREGGAHVTRGLEQRVVAARAGGKRARGAAARVACGGAARHRVPHGRACGRRP